ncbi:MAG: hypothetical protein ITG02_16340 [Patulibacter sp.]|nr:hypothetical protein [Patulibacter sp.]
MYRSRTVLALAVSAASAAALVPATGANAALLKGLQDQEMTVNFPDMVPEFLSASETAKVGLVRFNTRWDGKSSKPDGGQITGIRQFVQQAAASDSGITAIEVVPTVVGGSSFNPKGKKPGPTAASKVSVKAYSAYVQALATALRDLPVDRYYSALNEPNWFRHLPKRGGATLYRRLHNTAYTQIKRIDPEAKVLFGELLPYARPLSKNYPNGQSTNAGSFVRDVLGLDKNWKAKGSNKTYTVKADGVSLHTYDFKANPRKKRKDRDDWTQGNLGYAKSDLRKAARTKRLPSKAVSNIYLTEFAYKTRGSDKIPVGRAASYLKSAWSIAKKQKVKSFVWYQLRDPQTSAELWQSGLQTRSGSTRATWRAFVGLR